MTATDQQSNEVANTDTDRFSTPETNEHLSALQQEKARLENAVKHLERSNAELAEALAKEADPVYSDAVKENKRTVNNHQVEIYKLALEIAGITGEVAQVTPLPSTAQPAETNEGGQWL
jgi:predicted RNase H-like nuclease (RuvC/YqgF family)